MDHIYFSVRTIHFKYIIRAITIIIQPKKNKRQRYVVNSFANTTVCLSMGASRFHYWGGEGVEGPQLNKFEQDSSDDRQMSVDIPLPHERIDVFENITFPKLLLWVVITTKLRKLCPTCSEIPCNPFHQTS